MFNFDSDVESPCEVTSQLPMTMKYRFFMCIPLKLYISNMLIRRHYFEGKGVKMLGKGND